MITQDLIQKINFGAPAAERDMNYGLMEYFYETSSYRRMLSGQKTVLLGNRGSGKSAIFKILAKNLKNQGNIIIEILPEDYSYEILGEVLAKESKGNWAKQGAYSAAWKYVIYILAMKRLTASYPSLVKSNSRSIYNYLRDNHKGNHHLSKLDILISYLKRIEGIKIGQYEAGIKVHKLQELYKLEEINSLIPELESICSKRKIVFFIDELDRGWDSSEDAKAFISGLFQAALSINQITPSIRVLISLRKELYDNIPALYEDAQKVWDLFEVIEWDEPSLKKMIVKRIRKSLSLDVSIEDDEVWNSLYAETLAYRKNKSFNYLIDRTLYRPREIIQFCTEIKNSINENTQIPIDYEVISTAEYKYSEYRTKDIAAEYRFQYPGLLSIFEGFRGRSYNFNRDELEYLCIELILQEIPTSHEVTWLDGQEPAYLINVLWQIGFIRAQAIGGIKARRRSGSRYLGQHQISHLNLNNINNFHVHPMFRVYLGLKESK